MRNTVGIIGLGKIAGFHLRALEHIESIDVIAGADIDPNSSIIFRDRHLPVARSVSELLGYGPDVVIVATPTLIHFEIAQQVIKDPSRPRRLIVEKPVAANGRDVEDLLNNKLLTPDGIYHAAHAPEVLWAMQLWPTLTSRYGRVVSFEMNFADPYRNMDRGVRDHAYANSWFDSGINALSIAMRFTGPHRVESFICVDEDASTYETTVSAVGCTGKIKTTWDTDEPTKTSVFQFESGAVIHFDHQNVRAQILSPTELVEGYEYASQMPRLVAHYYNAFNSLLIEEIGYYGPEQTRHLHRLLFAHSE